MRSVACKNEFMSLSVHITHYKQPVRREGGMGRRKNYKLNNEEKRRSPIRDKICPWLSLQGYPCEKTHWILPEGDQAYLKSPHRINTKLRGIAWAPDIQRPK